MTFVSWIIFALVVWFMLPFIVPMAILYVIIRFLNVAMLGKGIEEVHNEK